MKKVDKELGVVLKKYQLELLKLKEVADNRKSTGVKKEDIVQSIRDIALDLFAKDRLINCKLGVEGNQKERMVRMIMKLENQNAEIPDFKRLDDEYVSNLKSGLRVWLQKNDLETWMGTAAKSALKVASAGLAPLVIQTHKLEERVRQTGKLNGVESVVVKILKDSQLIMDYGMDGMLAEYNGKYQDFNKCFMSIWHSCIQLSKEKGTLHQEKLIDLYAFYLNEVECFESPEAFECLRHHKGEEGVDFLSKISNSLYDAMGPLLALNCIKQGHCRPYLRVNESVTKQDQRTGVIVSTHEFDGPKRKDGSVAIDDFFTWIQKLGFPLDLDSIRDLSKVRMEYDVKMESTWLKKEFTSRPPNAVEDLMKFRRTAL
jgi:hypothetical protein